MIEIKIINIILLIGGFELEKGTTLDVGDTVWNEIYELLDFDRWKEGFPFLDYWIHYQFNAFAFRDQGKMYVI